VRGRCPPTREPARTPAAPRSRRQRRVVRERLHSLACPDGLGRPAHVGERHVERHRAGRGHDCHAGSEADCCGEVHGLVKVPRASHVSSTASGAGVPRYSSGQWTDRPSFEPNPHARLSVVSETPRHRRADRPPDASGARSTPGTSVCLPCPVADTRIPSPGQRLSPARPQPSWARQHRMARPRHRAAHPGGRAAANVGRPSCASCSNADLQPGVLCPTSP
jgi:hypothetical protein